MFGGGRLLGVPSMARDLGVGESPVSGGLKEGASESAVDPTWHESP